MEPFVEVWNGYHGRVRVAKDRINQALNAATVCSAQNLWGREVPDFLVV